MIMNPSKPLTEQNYLKAKDVKKMLCYDDNSAFYQAVRELAIPHIRINSRKFVFPEDALRAWMQKRSVGCGELST